VLNNEHKEKIPKIPPLKKNWERASRSRKTGGKERGWGKEEEGEGEVKI
jgi:hypothetical protein